VVLPKSFQIEAAFLTSPVTALVQSTSGQIFSCGVTGAHHVAADAELAVAHEAWRQEHEGQNTSHSAARAEVPVVASMRHVSVTTLSESSASDDDVTQLRHSSDTSDSVASAWRDDMEKLRLRALLRRRASPHTPLMVATPWDGPTTRGWWDNTADLGHTPLYVHLLSDMTRDSIHVHTPLRLPVGHGAGHGTGNRPVQLAAADGAAEPVVAWMGRHGQVAATVELPTDEDGAALVNNDTHGAQAVELFDVASMTTRLVSGPLTDGSGAGATAATAAGRPRRDASSKASNNEPTLDPHRVVAMCETVGGDAAVVSQGGVVRVWQVDKEAAASELEAWMKLFGVQSGQPLTLSFEEDEEPLVGGVIQLYVLLWWWLCHVVGMELCTPRVVVDFVLLW